MDGDRKYTDLNIYWLLNQCKIQNLFYKNNGIVFLKMDGNDIFDDIFWLVI
jgi:hypothetical protein